MATLVLKISAQWSQPESHDDVRSKCRFLSCVCVCVCVSETGLQAGVRGVRLTLVQIMIQAENRATTGLTATFSPLFEHIIPLLSPWQLKCIRDSC